MQIAMALLAAGCVVIGIVPGLVLRPLGAIAQELLNAPSLPEGTISLTHTLPLIAGCVVVLMIVLAGVRRVKRITPTWACGLPELDGRMQYSSTAFSKPLRKAFPGVYKAERKVEILYTDQPYFPKAMKYRATRTTSFENSLYRPAVDAIVGMATRLRRLQTGNIQVYLLYIFLALVALLFFMRFA
jgi:hydrogenase-4 component B